MSADGKAQDNNSPSAKVTDVKPKRPRKPLRSYLDYFVLSNVLGTDEFQTRHKTTIDNIVGGQVAAFSALSASTIEPSEKVRLIPYIDFYNRRIAALQLWWEEFLGRLLRVVLLQTIAPLFSWIMRVYLSVKSPLNIHGPTWYWWVIIVLYAILAVCLFSYYIELCNKFRDPIRLQSLLVLNAVTAIVTGYFAHSIINNGHPLGPLDVVLLIGLTSIFGTCGTYLAYTLEAVMVAYFFLRWRDTHYPDAVIITDLATLLMLVDTSPNHWEMLDFRRKLSVIIEHVAVCFERNIPAYLAPDDQGIRSWQRDNFLQVATSVRNLIMWVTTPKPDTRTFFLDHVRGLLTSVACGQWDLLEKAQPAIIPASKSLMLRVVGWGSVLTQAAIIPLGVLLFHHLEPLLTLPPYVYALAIGWPIVRLLAVWDPDVKSRIETIKEAMQLLPSSKAEKK